MELACELGLVYILELGDRLVCELGLAYVLELGDILVYEQGLDDRQVLVCVLEWRDNLEQAYELELEQHIPHKIHRQRNQYNDQQCI